MPLDVFIYRDRKAITLWLCCAALLIVCMVVLGGYTRLSGSGLSITEWKPIHGTIPPMNDQEWQQEFDGYVNSPQYQLINLGMTLKQFKHIFWPEYFHRLLGRAVGVVFLLPFIIFALRRSFSKRFGARMIVIFALGGVQGLIGWLMVQSGLINEPQVNPLRLAAHLLTAFALLGMIIWSTMDVAGNGQKTTLKRQVVTGYSCWFILLIFQIFLGAMMAGLHAGLIYNTWPSMNGQFVPDGLLSGSSWLTDVTFIQFLHRNEAVAVVLGFLLWWYFFRNHVKEKHLGKACLGVTSVIFLQFCLGVATLLRQAPLSLALLHQLVALLLFFKAVVLMHRLAENERT